MVAKMQRIADIDLYREVRDQIRARLTNSEGVNVAVDGGVVTLTGLVDSDAEVIAIESCAKQVPGVTALANELQVRPLRERSDTEIARDALNGLQHSIGLITDLIRVTVRDGRVFLEGSVHSVFQRMLAEAQVRRLRGIKGVSNKIEVKPAQPAGIANSEVEEISTNNNGVPSFEIGEAEAG